jgi:hemerythrin-like domain-containing protein
MEKENIITIIKNDHKPLKEGIQILTSESSKPAQKKSALKKFLVDLKLHAKTEEASLYDNVVEVKEVHDTVLEGYEEHSVADLLGDELEALGTDSELSDEIEAKAKVLAELVKHHIEEEEEEMLADLKKAVSEEELVRLGELYKQTYRKMAQQLAESHTRIKKESSNELSL